MFVLKTGHINEGILKIVSILGLNHDSSDNKKLDNCRECLLASVELAFLSTFAHVGASFNRIEGCVAALLQDDQR